MSFAHSETPELIRAMLGAVLRGRREAAGRSLSDLAEAASISPAYLSEVERGRKDVSTERLLAITQTLGVPLGQVYAELARGLGAERPVDLVAVSASPEAQLRMAAVALSPVALRAVADFSAYMLMSEGSPRRQQIGFRPRGQE